VRRHIATLAAVIAFAALATVISVIGAMASAAIIHPGVTRNQRVVIEIDPNDSGTAKYHCHSHAITGANHNTFVFTHCKHGLD